MSGGAKHRLRSEFIFILSFAPFLPRSRVSELLDQRLAETNEVLRDLDRREAEEALQEGQRFCIGFGRAMMEAQRDYIMKHSAELLATCPDDVRELNRAGA